MAKKKSGLKKILHDYPIIPVLIIVFLLGVWFGFKIGQKAGGPYAAAPKPPARAVPATPPVYEETSVKRVPLKPSEHPQPVFSPVAAGFKKPATADRDVRVLPVPPKPEKPKILVIIDDIGYHTWYQDLIFSLKQPIVLAVLPQVPYSKYYAEQGRKRGFDVILHQPFEPNDSSIDPGPGLIKSGMNATQVKKILETNLKTVPGAIGINSHMGSKATRDWHLMLLVAKELERKKLIVIDSRTTPKAVGYEAARAVGIPALILDVFLDSADVKSVEGQLDQAAKIAKSRGLAVVIGHPYENTLWALKQRLPQLEAEGFEFVRIRDLVS